MNSFALLTILQRAGKVLLLFWVWAGTCMAQDMLRVAESQMAAGLASDARVIVEDILASGAEPSLREKALFYQAALTGRGDSAFRRLEMLAGRVEPFSRNVASEALERLGDFAYFRGDYLGAGKYWIQAEKSGKEVETRQRLLVKKARADLRLANHTEALAALGKALELGESPQTGMIRFWRGIAFQAVNDTKGAAADYMAVYNRPVDPYQYAALYYLTAIYGQGSSRTAIDWRKRWNQTARQTIFEAGEIRKAQVKNPAVYKEKTQSLNVKRSSFSIQLGAFSTTGRARELADRVHRLGLDPVVLPRSVDNLYRVQIQGLVDRKEVDRVASVLRKNRIECQIISPGG
jgi:tetratricopeptide (TPR) repeat protein